MHVVEAPGIRFAKLGEGTYGSVYQMRPPNGGDYSFKVFNREDRICLQWERFILENITLHGGHPSIIRYFGLLRTSDNQLGLHLELGGKDLHGHIKNGRVFSTLETVEVARKVAEGLFFLKQKKIIHGDIKPANILLSEDNSVKIVDFGISILGETGNLHPAQAEWYRSPEAVLQVKYTAAIDMWGLACVIFEIFQRRALFPSNNERHLVAMQEYVLDGGYEEELINSASPSRQEEIRLSRQMVVSTEIPFLEELGEECPLLPILQAMLDFSPKSRMTAEEFLLQTSPESESFAFIDRNCS